MSLVAQEERVTRIVYQYHKKYSLITGNTEFLSKGMHSDSVKLHLREKQT